MTDTRTYIRMHDGMPEHPKIEPLSDAAFRLLVTTWCWCSRQTTDGRIPKKLWLKRGTAIRRKELQDAGLVVEQDEWVIVHDYLEHQRSSEEIQALRERRARAGKLGGEAKAKSVASARGLPDRLLSKNVPSTETDTEIKREPLLVSPLRGDVESLCEHLADRIEKNGSRRPVVREAWRTAARLMLERDGLSTSQVNKIINWCQDDEFWRANILSMPKLREKFDQLRLQAEQRGPRQNGVVLQYAIGPKLDQRTREDLERIGRFERGSQAGEIIGGA